MSDDDEKQKFVARVNDANDKIFESTVRGNEVLSPEMAEKVKALVGDHKQAQVLFWVLPVGEWFTHKGVRYQKTAEEQAAAVGEDFVVMEPHYGCIISAKRFVELGLADERGA